MNENFIQDLMQKGYVITYQDDPISDTYTIQIGKGDIRVKGHMSFSKYFPLNHETSGNLNFDFKQMVEKLVSEIEDILKNQQGAE